MPAGPLEPLGHIPTWQSSSRIPSREQRAVPFQELLEEMLGLPFPVWGTSPGTEPSLGFQSRTNIASVEGTVSSRSVSGLRWEEGKDVWCACHVGVSALPAQPNHQGSCKIPAPGRRPRPGISVTRVWVVVWVIIWGIMELPVVCKGVRCFLPTEST